MGYEMRVVNFCGESKRVAVSTGTSAGKTKLRSICKTKPIAFPCTKILYARTNFVRGKPEEKPVHCSGGYCEYHAPDNPAFCPKHS